MDSEILEALKQEVIETVKEIQGTTELVKAKSWSEAWNILPSIIKKVENLGQIKDLKGEYKRQLAIEVINYFVDIPMIPEWAEGKIIGFVLDAIIGFLNKTTGHNWLSQILW